MKSSGRKIGGPKPTNQSFKGSRSSKLIGECTVKRLQPSKALFLTQNTSVKEACRRMAKSGVDALLLKNDSENLSGILTDKDIATRVISLECNLEDTPVSKVMTRDPKSVNSDTLAFEALQKMLDGKFRHLPVLENGEIVGLLGIRKCLHDTIGRMNRAFEKGNAIASAVGASNKFVETLLKRLFRPTLSTIILQNSKVLTVSPSDTVLMTAKKMEEMAVGCAVVTVNNKLCGILTSKDILMRVIAQNLSPKTTIVDNVMTSSPECATVDTPVCDALIKMQEIKCLHLPVVDEGGNMVAVVNVDDITHAVVAYVKMTDGSSGIADALGDEPTSSMIQLFWHSALVNKDEGCRSIASGGEIMRSPLSITFAFKFQDKMGLMHRFNCNIQSLAYLMTAITQRLGEDIGHNKFPQILYEDDDRDKIVLASDEDLVTAVDLAKQLSWKCLRLYLVYPILRPALEKEEQFMRCITKEYGKISSRDHIVACKIWKFTLTPDYSIEEFTYDGKSLHTENGSPRDIKVISVGILEEYAERVFNLTCNVKGGDILCPLSFCFFKQDFNENDVPLCRKEALLSKGFWGLCYEKYISLSDWCADVKSKKIESSKDENVVMRDKDGCLSHVWRRKISSMLATISKIHVAKSYHGELGERSSYVFLNGELMLIKVENTLEAVSSSSQSSICKDDYKNFRNLLKDLLEPAAFWDERDKFLHCFDDLDHLNDSSYLHALLKHPFLMTAKDRMDEFGKIYKVLYSKGCLHNVLGGSDFTQFVGWNKAIGEPLLLKVYNYKDSNQNKVNYRCYASSLLRFLRNVNEHYRDQGSQILVEDLDSLIRSKWRGLLDLVYFHACYLQCI